MLGGLADMKRQGQKLFTPPSSAKMLGERLDTVQALFVKVHAGITEKREKKYCSTAVAGANVKAPATRSKSQK